eukprot:CAMPEP_0113936180 /NCGR_PEP_ID=MMETSP1339-20121228/3147_1 /TAXON_ID=94617 /ORGANISM="Fibrocapsa japonica" /LENGTH=582 /DNA_ID=CAMNT_0000938559 /DNA_START=79 /DNA_END=1827 /DNA_ORIENTATION=+ /assembly_acc=CAM_ASM_000762
MVATLRIALVAVSFAGVLSFLHPSHPSFTTHRNRWSSQSFALKQPDESTSEVTDKGQLDDVNEYLLEGHSGDADASKTLMGEVPLMAEDLDSIEPPKGPTKAEIQAKAWFDTFVEGQRRRGKDKDSASDPAIIQGLAEKADEVLADLALPTRRQEPYRYTDLESLYRTTYQQQQEAEAAQVTKEDVEPYLVQEAQGQTMVFVNGVLSPEFSDLTGLGAAMTSQGVYVGGATTVPSDKVEAFSAEVKDFIEVDRDHRTTQGTLPFACINQLCISDVACIYVPAGVELQKPVQVVFLSTASTGEVAAASHQRMVVVMEKDAKMHLIQSIVGKGEAHFTNGLSQVKLGEGAGLKHSHTQELPSWEEGVSASTTKGMHQVMDAMYVSVADGASFNTTLVEAGAQRGRTSLQVHLNGPDSYTEVQGATFTGDRQRHTVLTSIAHNAEKGTSRQQQRNVVGQGGDCTFKGRIRVEQVAQKTDSDQLCRTLLLDENAMVTAMPSLEIIADDVKCTHGVTVTDMDEESLFYMRARGIDTMTARRLIVNGFAEEVLADIPCDKIRSRILDKVDVLIPKKDYRGGQYEWQSI